MKMRKLGRNGPEVSAVGLGCMGMSAFYGAADEAQSIAVIHRALDLGVTLFDTAEMYGPHTNEVLLGKALKGRRNEAFIATKFGINRQPDGSAVTDGSPANVRARSRAASAVWASIISTSITSTASTPIRRSRRRSGRWPSW
jgi:aryl-alcohol dehydrogenase-like predicted oxidoreductase